MRMLLSSMLALLLLAPVIKAQEDGGGDAERAYYRAFYLEQGLRDFEKAETAYGEAVDLAVAAKRTDLAARSHLGRARCFLARGNREEAAASVALALRMDPELAEAKDLKAELERPEGGAEDDCVLRSRILITISKLGGPERPVALRDLQLIGDRAVPQLAEALQDSRVGVVEGAAKALATIGSPSAHAALVAAYEDENVAFRPALDGGALANVNPGAEGGLEVFLSALHHGTEAERAAAMGSLRFKSGFLREVPAPAVARIIRDGISDPSPRMKTATLAFLRSMAGKTRASELLADLPWPELLGSDDPDICIGAARVLGYVPLRDLFDEPMAQAALKAIRSAIEGRLEPAPLPYLISLINGGLPFPPREVAALYAEAHGENSVLSLEQRNRFHGLLNIFFAEVKDTPSRTEVFEEHWHAITNHWGRWVWFRTFANTGAVPDDTLLAAAADADAAIRGQAYKALRGRAIQGEDQIAPERVANALEHIEDDLLGEDDDLRQELLRLLYNVPAANAVDPLEKLVRTPGEPGIREFAAMVLARTSGGEAAPFLRERIAAGDRADLRTPLITAAGTAAAPDLVALAERLGDGGKAVTAEKSGNLVVAGDVLDAYMRLLPERLRSPELIGLTARQLPEDFRKKLVLFALSRRDNPRFLVIGARLAGDHQIEEAWPHLLPLLDHADASVRNAAKDALEKIRSFRELRASFQGADPRARQNVRQRATALLESEDPVKREGGALALGALGDLADVPTLLDLLDDPEPRVRAAALAALRKLGGTPADGE